MSNYSKLRYNIEVPNIAGLVSVLLKNQKVAHYGKRQYYTVCFCKNFRCGIYFVNTIPLIFGCGNTVDGSFMDSYSIYSGDQLGGKDIKHDLSVVQI